MRMATVQDITVNVHGNAASVQLTPGALVDLDVIVGHQDGVAVTLEQALGPALCAKLSPVTPSVDMPARSRRGFERRQDKDQPQVSGEKE